MAEKAKGYGKGDADDILTEAKAAFREAQDAESDNREAALEDLRFARLGQQWPEEIAKQRALEGRPMLTINKLIIHIRQVVNDARQNKPSIRTRPVDSKADVETAEVINGIIRHIEYNSSADIAYDTGIEAAVGMGFGYWRIGLEYARDDTFDMDLTVIPVPDPMAVYGDPYAVSADGSDWMSAFVIERMKKSRFEQKYGEASTLDWAEYEASGPDWFADNLVTVAEWWVREEATKTIIRLPDGTVVDEARLPELLAQGVVIPPDAKTRIVPTFKVKQCILTGAEVLERREWPGKYIPIVPVYGDVVNEEGTRHFRSLIRDAKDAQRMFNFWRTNSTELIALAPRTPWIGPKGAFSDVDADKWATSNTKSHPTMEYASPPGTVTRIPLDASAVGSIQEALNASDDIKAATGQFDASLGARSNETSGRAIMARQREGDVSTFHFIDNLTRSIRHSGRILLDLIPHVWPEERIVRLLGEDGKTVTEQKVNAPVPVMDEKTGQPMMEPDPMQMGQQRPQMRVFSLTQGKYDLTASAGPSYTSKREEAATQMMEFIRLYPDSAPMIGDLVASNLDWPGADEIADRLKAMLPAQLQGQDGGIPPELQQQIEEGTKLIQQLQAENEQLKADKTAEIAKVQADQQAKMADLAAEDKKLQVESLNERARLDLEREKLTIERFKAQTDRIEAEAKMIEAKKPDPPPLAKAA